MPQLAITYDITRLMTRLLNLTPNGIDRVDSAFARHYLGQEDGGERFGTVWTPLGPHMLPRMASADAVAAIDAHWGETRAGETDAGYQDLVARLSGGHAALDAVHARVAKGRSGRLRQLVGWLSRHGISRRRTPERDLPPRAVYLNGSQFPLWVPSYFTWLERRRDVRAVFFIHDLLPLEMPEYFRAAEFERHRRRLANLARFGTAAIVTTSVVRDALADHLKGLGRGDFPILVAPTPMSPVFFGPGQPDAALAANPYFVICSTIEPRKNHLMLLHVWRELVRREGEGAPRLVIVGNRGWKFGPVVDLMEQSPALRGRIVEVSGLSTPGLRRLLDGARALLMPSFGEGYGLPVHEALAAGVPVIASDIPAFREIDHPLLRHLSPIDGEGWLAAIRQASRQDRRLDGGLPAATVGASWSGYFDRVDAFLAQL